MIRCTRFQSGDISMKMIQGLIDVHPSFQNSTLESFVSHGSGAPGLNIVVDKYHDMVGNIPLRKHDLSSGSGESMFMVDFVCCEDQFFRWITFSTRPAGSQALTTGQPVSTYLKLF